MLMLNGALLAFDASVFGRSLVAPRSPTEPVPAAIQKLWTIAMEGNLYSLVSAFGVTIAVFAAGFWCLKFYQGLQEGTLTPAMNQLLWPFLLVLLLSNGGKNLRSLTMTTRDVMNNMNSLVNQTVSAEVSIKSANEVLSNNFWVSIAVNAQYRACAASPYPDRIVSCINGAKIFADGLVGAQNPGVSNNAEYQAQLNKWKDAQLASNAELAKRAIEAVGQQNPATASGTPGMTGATTTGNPSSSILDAEYYTHQGNLDSVVSTIMSFKKGFVYIIEIMMLVHGLIGPIPLGLSLFPVGTKPVMAWGVSFLTLGFCKICYSLISGLSSIAFIYAGPENTDMTVVAVVLGILSPVLAFSIASSAGIGALNGIIGPAQMGGINFGLGYRAPNNNEK